VAVFKYSAVAKNREEMTESGTIVADNEQQAREKLERMDLSDVRVRRIGGISGLLKSLTADIR
jgi:type II secretory pathway component PulF